MASPKSMKFEDSASINDFATPMVLSHRMTKMSQLNSFRESKEKSSDHNTKERGSKEFTTRKGVRDG